VAEPGKDTDTNTDTDGGAGTGGRDDGDGVAGPGRVAQHRGHRFPGRRNAIKVLYDDPEAAAVRAAAQLAGLTASGYVAAAGLHLAGTGPAPVQGAERAVLAELLAARSALRRYGVNLNQAVAALNSGAGAPVWLHQAVHGCAAAAGRIDEVTVTLTRRLG